MSNQQIIIIDDDQVFREILSRSLSNLQRHVEHYSHPDEALTQSSLWESSDDQQLVVLLDLKLESDSGLRWITRLRSANRACRIILLTGYASISTAVEAIKLGADDYLSKPVTARDILKHLEKEEADPDMPINDNPMSVGRLEWEHIQRVLKDNNGNISASARALGMHRRTLQRKLSKKPVKK